MNLWTDGKVVRVGIFYVCKGKGYLVVGIVGKKKAGK